jgi:hypothetical protein
VEETGIPGENHWPVTSHWQTLAQNIASSTQYDTLPIDSPFGSLMFVVLLETIVCLSLPSKPHLMILGLETSVKNSHLQITDIKFIQTGIAQMNMII